MRFYRKSNQNKLHAEKVTVDNISFASKKEAKRYCELKLLLQAGEISHLELQKEYVLIPSQYEESREVYTRGEKKGQPKQGRLLERGISYVADFVYIDERNQTLVVEDVKGYRDPSSAPYAKFVMKRKLMLYFYGIQVKEI